MVPLPIATSACMIDPSGVGMRSRSVPSNAAFRNAMNCAPPRTTTYGVIDVNPGRK